MFSQEPLGQVHIKTLVKMTNQTNEMGHMMKMATTHAHTYMDFFYVKILFSRTRKPTTLGFGI